MIAQCSKGSAMPLRFHFTDDDLVRVRLAQEPDVLWESLLSMHLLQTADSASVFGHWRGTVREQLTPRAREVVRLAPPTGYSPDFLTPTAGEGSVDAAIDALLGTPPSRVHRDLSELARSTGHLPRTARCLREGNDTAIERLAVGTKEYFDIAVEPLWPRIERRFHLERAAHVRQFAHASPGPALAALHPSLSWDEPVLTVTGIRIERDVHLGGRGILVLPSFFCRRLPTVLRDPGLPPVLVLPMALGDRAPAERSPGEAVGPEEPLDTLLGRTRASILRVSAVSRTTTELARRTGVSTGTASYHAKVLREAGLMVSRRAGTAVLHHLTPLGRAMVDGRGAVG